MMIVQQIIDTNQEKVDQTNQAEIQEKLVRFINETEHQDILVNFKTVEFIDASGLIALVNVYKQARNQNKKVYLLNVLPKVKIIFEISRLDQILAIRELDYDSSEEPLNIIAA